MFGAFVFLDNDYKNEDCLKKNVLSMRIEYEFAIYCLNNGLDRHYAHFLMFKKQYCNSTINNYTSYKLAKKSGVSRSNVEKYVSYFIANGWCKKRENGSLFFKKVRCIMNEMKIKGTQVIKFKEGFTVREILNNIRISELKNKCKKWNWLKKVSELDDANIKDKRKKATFVVPVFRHSKRLRSNPLTCLVAPDAYTVSLNTMSRRINKSKSTVSREIKFAEKRNMVSVTRHPIEFVKNKIKVFSFLSSDGKGLPKSFSNFLQYPNSYAF